MASAVTALQAGIAAAPSGRVEFFTHGTSTLSSLVYSDADGAYPVTTTTLDAYGFAERYVGEPVDVVVYKADGSTLRTFTHVDDAKVVRLETSAFTGPNTNGNGQIVAGGRTTEDSAWTLLGASLAGTDGGVASGSTLIPISGLASLVFFDAVRSYGADPLGVDDSTTAINSAIDAAVAATGGVVWLQAGTYKVTATLKASATGGGVRFVIMGPSPVACIIKQYTDGATTLTASATCSVSGVRFTSDAAATTGKDIVSGGRLALYNCEFSVPRTQQIDNTGSSMIAVSCRFFISTANAAISVSGTSATVCHFTACVFTISIAGLATGMFANMIGVFTGCEFAISVAQTLVFGASMTAHLSGCDVNLSATSGTTILSNTTLIASASGFRATAAGNLQIAGAAATLYESACGLVATSSGTVTIGSPTGGRSASREIQKASSTAATTSYTPDAANYGVHLYNQNGGAAFTLNNPSADCPALARLIVIWSNASGSNITPAFGTAYAAPAAVIVNNGQAACWEFIKGDGTTTTKYVAVGPETIFTP